MDITDRFLQYIKFNTASSEDNINSPTSLCQFDLAKLLSNELKAMGVSDVFLDRHCYVYGKIPASLGYESSKKIGFIAHLDTIPDYPGKGISPQIFTNYNGEDVPLGESGRILKTSQFPHLKQLIGQMLITTNGLTVLGADDKAGIAEIMTVIDELFDREIPHGEIFICFVPDEEVYASTTHINLEKFSPDYAYTIDGNEVGELVFENFNACKAIFEISGFNIHTGIAKNVLINAGLVAIEINQSLPSEEIPSKTEGYDGFFHLVRIEGVEKKAYLEYLVRDHDLEEYNARKDLLCDIEQTINDKYGKHTACLTIIEQYKNMAQIIKFQSSVVQYAIEAIRKAGFNEIIRPCRGSSAGAKLSYLGIPCPNIGVGGYAFHGPFEHITTENMENVVKIILEIISKYSTLKCEENNEFTTKKDK